MATWHERKGCRTIYTHIHNTHVQAREAEGNELAPLGLEGELDRSQALGAQLVGRISQQALLLVQEVCNEERARHCDDCVSGCIIVTRAAARAARVDVNNEIGIRACHAQRMITVYRRLRGITP